MVKVYEDPCYRVMTDHGYGWHVEADADDIGVEIKFVNPCDDEEGRSVLIETEAVDLVIKAMQTVRDSIVAQEGDA